MSLDVVVVGAGGHGREVLGVIQAINAADPAGPTWRVLGFVDDGPPQRPGVGTLPGRWTHEGEEQDDRPEAHEGAAMA